MLSYLDTASIDLLRIARIAILAVALASMVGAVLGVALQRATLSPTMQRCGWILLVLCLAIQPLSLAVTFSIDSEIGLRQHMTVLKSRERVANRTLSRSEKDRLSASLALFSGQTVETIEFPVSFESDWIANQIQALLDKALWIASPVSRLSAPPRWCKGFGCRQQRMIKARRRRVFWSGCSMVPFRLVALIPCHCRTLTGREFASISAIDRLRCPIGS